MAFGQVGAFGFTSPEWISGLIERDWARSDAERAQVFSAESAQKQMDFQERMSNTQWQRGVSDMQSAGLNPMLAYSQGGASSPQGAAFPGIAPHRTGFGNSAFSVQRQTDAQTNLLQAEAELVEAKTDTERGKPALQDQEFKVLFYQAEKLLQEGLNLGAAHEKLIQEIGKAKYSIIKEKYETLLLMQEFEELRPEELKALKATAELLGLEIPKALNEATAEGSAWKREVAPYLRDLGTLSHSVRDLAAGAAASAFAHRYGGRLLRRRR